MLRNNKTIVACCFRSIHDLIALTKNNNIDLRTKSEVNIVFLGQCDKIMYGHQVDIVILGQCDKFMYRPHQHAIIVYYRKKNSAYVFYFRQMKIHALHINS